VGLLPDGPQVLGAPLSHWAALFGAAILSFAVAWLLVAGRGPIEKLIRRGGAETKLSHFMEASAAPLRVLIALVLSAVTVEALEVSVVARYRVLFLAQIVGWIGTAWLLWRWADAGGDVILSRMSRSGQLTAYSAVSFLNRVIKGLLVVLLLATMLRAFGV